MLLGGGMNLLGFLAISLEAYEIGDRVWMEESLSLALVTQT